MIYLTRYGATTNCDRVNFAQAAGDMLTFATAKHAYVDPGGHGFGSSIAVVSLGRVFREYNQGHLGEQDDFVRLYRLARTIQVVDNARDSDRTEVYLPENRRCIQLRPVKAPQSQLAVAHYAAAWVCERSEVPEVPGLYEANLETAAAALGLAVEKELTDGTPFEKTILELL